MSTGSDLIASCDGDCGLDHHLGNLNVVLIESRRYDHRSGAVAAEVAILCNGCLAKVFSMLDKRVKA